MGGSEPEIVISASLPVVGEHELLALDLPVLGALDVLHLLAEREGQLERAEVARVRRDEAIDEARLGAEPHRAREPEHRRLARLRGLRRGVLGHRVEVQDRRGEPAQLLAFDEAALGERRVEREDRAEDADHLVAAEGDPPPQREALGAREQVVAVAVEGDGGVAAVHREVVEAHLRGRPEERDLLVLVRADGALQLEGHRPVGGAADREMRELPAVLGAGLGRLLGPESGETVGSVLGVVRTGLGDGGGEPTEGGDGEEERGANRACGHR